jgi:transcription antitermination factor NusG
MTESKNWYAVYTRPKMEKKVSVQLNRAGIENYCPLNRVNRLGNDPKKFILEPLFSSCVFVRVTEAEHEVLKNRDGVISMVYWLGKPVVINQSEIMIIKSMLADCTNIKLEKKPINLNSKANITREINTKIEEQESDGIRTKILMAPLHSLGYIMKAEVETGSIRVIEQDSAKHFEVGN